MENPRDHKKLMFYFAEEFTTILEEKRHQYNNEFLGRTERNPNSQHAAIVATAVGERCSLGILAGLITTGVCWLLSDHKGKAGNVVKLFQNDDNLRKEIVNAGLILFQIFENQYLKISNVRNGENNLKILAQDAVERVMNFINQYKREGGRNFMYNLFLFKKPFEQAENLLKEYTLDKPENLRDFITYCFINGSSKNIFSTAWSTRTVSFGTENWNISKMYKKVGLCVKVGDGETFYKRKSKSYLKTSRSEQMEIRLMKKYGFRLPLPWEKEISSKYEEIENISDDYKYNYLCESNIMEETWKEVYDNLNKNDPTKMPGRVYDLSTVVQECISGQSVNKRIKLFKCEDPVTYFTGRIDHLSKIKEMLSKNSCVVVTGMAGIGKSELVRKFASDSVKNFDSVVCINAESKIEVENSFKNVAKSITEVDSKRQAIHEIVDEVYKHLNNSKVLIIFDNVEKYEDISSFLPNFQINFDEKKVIITSQNQSWDQHIDEIALDMIHLTEFEESEAIIYIGKILKQPLDESEVKELASAMEFFPLALKQATKYIKLTSQRTKRLTTKNFGIKDYLENFQSDLLNYKATDSERYNKTLYTTLQMTMNCIGKIPNGDDAVHLIKMMAYLAPEEISVQHIFGDVLLIDPVFQCAELLHNYSLIALEGGVVRMRSLVQQVIRSSLTKDEEEIYLKFVCQIVYENVQTNKLHLPHIWKYGSKFRDIVEEFYIQTVTQSGDTPLHLLLKNEECDSCVDLIENLKDIWPNKIKNLLDSKEFLDGLTPLHIACEIGSLDIVTCLLEAGASVGSTTYNGESVLHSACKGANLDVVKLIIDMGVSPECKSKCDVSVLHSACCNYSKQSSEIINYLVSLKIDVNCNDSLKNTPLHFACAYENFSAVESLCRKGADVSSRNEEGRSPLHIACVKYKFESYDRDMQSSMESNTLGEYRRKDFETLFLSNCVLNSLCVKRNYSQADNTNSKESIKIINYLIENKADVNAVDENGLTPLHVACKQGNEAEVKIFWQKCANSSSENNSKLLHWASARGNVDTIQFLLSENFGVNNTDEYGNTPLHIACYNGNYDVVKMLHDKGAYLFRKNKNHHTLLHFAAIGGNPEIIKYLLEKKLPVDDLDINKNTPLHIACERGHYIAVELLCAKGADLHSRNEYGSTTLHSACIAGNTKVIAYILQDLKINCVDQNGDTPLHIAARHGHLEVLQQFSSLLENVTCENNIGNTLLSNACYGKYVNIVDYLIKGDFDENYVDINGNTILHIASEYGNLEVVKTICDLTTNLYCKKNNRGFTALHSACCRTEENIEILEHFITIKLDINCTNNCGDTPLHLACIRGKYNSVMVLWNAVEDKNNYYSAKNISGSTLLHSACNGSNVHIIDHFLKNNFNVDCLDEFCKTPLHITCEKGDYPAFKRLCEKVKNFNHANFSTLLHSACEGGNLDIVKYLIKNVGLKKGC